MSRFQLTVELSRRGGQRSGERQLAKTHCPRGHEYAGDNLYIGSRGERVCRTCKKLKAVERNVRIKKQRIQMRAAQSLSS